MPMTDDRSLAAKRVLLQQMALGRKPEAPDVSARQAAIAAEAAPARAGEKAGDVYAGTRNLPAPAPRPDEQVARMAPRPGVDQYRQAVSARDAERALANDRYLAGLREAQGLRRTDIDEELAVARMKLDYEREQRDKEKEKDPLEALALQARRSQLERQISDPYGIEADRAKDRRKAATLKAIGASMSDDQLTKVKEAQGYPDEWTRRQVIRQGMLEEGLDPETVDEVLGPEVAVPSPPKSGGGSLPSVSEDDQNALLGFAANPMLGPLGPLAVGAARKGLRRIGNPFRALG